MVAVCVVLWGLVSARFERANVTAPVAFVARGLIAANRPLSLIDVNVRSEDLRSMAEVTLALVLFADASRVNGLRAAPCGAGDGAGRPVRTTRTLRPPQRRG